jgi:predicted porin
MSFGEILLGSENSAGYKMTYAAPDVTFINVNSGSLTAFIPFSGTATGADVFRGVLGTSYLENAGAANNDAQRITYFTPRFAGFQVGVSYARDGLQDNNGQINTNAVTLHDIFDVGANYVNSFGGFDIALSGRYGFADDNNGGDPQVWAAGLNLGFGGFTIGGSYGEQTGAGVMNGEVYDVGVSYTTGPWGFSVTYIHGESVNDEEGAGGNDETLEQFLVGMSYNLAKGVKLSAYGAYVDFDEPSSDPGGADDIDGFVIGTGVKISF